MHDYFHILGVSRDARASEIRRACCRHARPPHPDIFDGDRGADAPINASREGSSLAGVIDLSDAAVDFVEVPRLVDRVLASFFQDPATPQA